MQFCLSNCTITTSIFSKWWCLVRTFATVYENLLNVYSHFLFFLFSLKSSSAASSGVHRQPTPIVSHPLAPCTLFKRDSQQIVLSCGNPVPMMDDFQSTLHTSCTPYCSTTWNRTVCQFFTNKGEQFPLYIFFTGVVSN